MKRRDRAAARARAAAPAPVRGTPTTAQWWGAAAALAAALLVVVLAWAARGNLNVDGVSYLELAHRVGAADWSAFVQGYWSPLYPILLALPLALTGASGADAIGVAHGVNAMIALGVIALLHGMARQRGNATWGLLAITAFLVCSARTVRVDAVTPDLLLLLAVTGLAAEWLRPGGWRALPTGLWAAMAFLAKTSSWPWLAAVAIGALLFGWHDGGVRRRILIGAAAALVPITLWVAAMSRDAGTPTLGSSARLNACWYLFTCDGRTPDTHAGDHQDYQVEQVAAGATARLAVMSDTTWTYPPWSDPTAWQARLVTQERVPPSVWEFVSYVGVQLALVVGLWSALLIGLVIVPACALTKGAPTMRTHWRTPAAATVMAGMLGVLQFAAVHAEPRLVAPFTLLVALGILEWRRQGEERRALPLVAAVACVVALGIGGYHVRDQLLVTASAAARVAQLAPSHPAVGAPHPVAVIGPALPMLPDLYRARVRVVAQVFAPSPTAMQQWTPEAQRALGERLARLGAREVWLSRGRAAYSIALLTDEPAPPRGPSGP